MANAEHLAILKQGVEAWNKWREENEHIIPDLRIADLYRVDLPGINLSNALLSCAYLSNIDLSGANLSKSDLSGANLAFSNLSKADLSDAKLVAVRLAFANLSEANLVRAYMFHASMDSAKLTSADLTWAILLSSDLKHAKMTSANLMYANLCGADLSHADLVSANLYGASFVQTNLTGATIESANVYGISAWDIEKEGLIQNNLVLTRPNHPIVTVDNLEIAQFIYLLLNNEKFRDVIETVTSKAVLILGRFTYERKKVLDAIRDELRNRNFLPILFDFEKPATRDLTETISILAKLSRFVIADLTEAKSIPQELSHIVPNMPSLPVIPLILKGQSEYGMFEHWPRYPWVLPIYRYENEGHLIATLSAGVIEPAERKVQEIRTGK